MIFHVNRHFDEAYRLETSVIFLLIGTGISLCYSKIKVDRLLLSLDLRLESLLNLKRPELRALTSPIPAEAYLRSMDPGADPEQI